MSGPAGMGMVAGGPDAGRASVFGSTAMLASVTNCDEAAKCVAAGVDVIDCKDPANGALGALPLDVVAEICRHVDGRVPVSATIGDLPCRSGDVLPAAAAMAETGCDIVKVGLLPGGSPDAVIADLGSMFGGGARRVGGVGLVAVLFADLQFDCERLMPLMQSAGFAGVMMDTADKGAGRLMDHLDHGGLERFIAAAHDAGLFAGLAGSLRLLDIGGLLALKPDVLGFRGGLCVNGLRGFGLDEGSLLAVRRAIRPRTVWGADINQAARTGL